MTPSGKNIYTYLMEYARECPDKKLLGSRDGWLSVSRVLSLVDASAGALVHLGIGRGDMVALRASRSLETVLIMLALSAIGAVAVLTSPHKPVELFLSGCADSISVKAIISNEWSSRDIWDGSSQIFMDAATRKKTPFDPFRLPYDALPAQDVDPHAPAYIIFTSGSTGKSKAVMLSQYNLVNNLVDSHPLGYYDESDIALGALPLEHVFGLVLLAGTIVLRYAIYLTPGSGIPVILTAIETQGVTRMNGVPSLYLTMVDQKAGHDLHTLRVGFIGGGPCTPEQFCHIEKELDMTLIPVYGMSECIGISCASFRDTQAVRSRGVGPFYSMNTGKILLEDGTEAAPGQEGEICVDGPARMVGYYGDTAPRKPLLHTGDLGFVDEMGILHISGRKKDIVIRNGVNLSPLRIEQALLSIPGIADAAVVGLSDNKAGELPWAMVVCDDPAPADILEALQPLLPKNELPAGIMQVNTLPRTTSGKPDKPRIREVLSKWLKA